MGFPAPGYARLILEPAFRFASEHLFDPMMAANKAHAVMLIEQAIIERTTGSRLLNGILAAEAGGAASYQYDPAVEDLFFAVERRIIDLAGEEAGGNLQLGRSRNDLSAAMCRLVLRTRLLDLAQRIVRLGESLMLLAGSHVDTVMPGVTHTQEAQPTTLAHYLLGVLGPLQRDGERLTLAYDHTNRSPLGVAAFTTSSLPVDRTRVAHLLGFSGIVENGYDAVGAADYMLEATGALRTLCLSLVRFVNDLLVWARSDVAIARVGDEFIQISSIMPQKRNPVVLEHIRARIGYVIGDAATVEAMVHAAAFGDTVDVEDEIYVPLLRCCDSAVSVLSLLSDVLGSLKIERERLDKAARAGFGASTELAERLTIDHGLPFRQAHRVVALIVRDLAASGRDLRSLSPEMVEMATKSVTGTGIAVTRQGLKSAIDPVRFVARRALPGGPAAPAVMAALQREQANREALSNWVTQQREGLTRARDELNGEARRLARPAT